MRTAAAVLTMLSIAFAGFAQSDPAEPHDVKVVKFNWSRVVAKQTDRGLDPADERFLEDIRDPRLNRPTTSDKVVIESWEAPGEADRQRRRGVSKEPDEKDVDGYVYKVTLQNKASTAIVAVHWDYLFVDPVDQSEVDRRPFYSSKRIEKGKKKELSEFSQAPPTRTVSATAAEKENNEFPYVGKIVINRVEYDNGTYWTRDGFKPPEAEPRASR